MKKSKNAGEGSEQLINYDDTPWTPATDYKHPFITIDQDGNLIIKAKKEELEKIKSEILSSVSSIAGKRIPSDVEELSFALS